MQLTKKWYVIHTYSGYENRVTANLEKKIQSLGMENEIFRTLVPMELEVEITKDGQRKEKKKKKYPGYVFVEMIHSDRSWYVVRNTPGVTGFVGSGNKPVPLTESEVAKMFKDAGFDDENAETAVLRMTKTKIDLELQQVVRIKEEPFKDFTGTVIEIDNERTRVKVLVAIFGKDTPVDLDVSQVEKFD